MRHRRQSGRVSSVRSGHPDGGPTPRYQRRSLRASQGCAKQKGTLIGRSMCPASIWTSFCRALTCVPVPFGLPLSVERFCWRLKQAALASSASAAPLQMRPHPMYIPTWYFRQEPMYIRTCVREKPTIEPHMYIPTCRFSRGGFDHLRWSH